MSKAKNYSNELLNIQVVDNNGDLEVNWTGKSIARKPGKFITPIMVNVLKQSSNKNKRIIVDFTELDYMNSSSITPIIKILERAKNGTVQIHVLYKKNLKWQELIFSALEIFQTKDDRIEIKGL